MLVLGMDDCPTGEKLCSETKLLVFNIDSQQVHQQIHSNRRIR